MTRIYADLHGFFSRMFVMEIDNIFYQTILLWKPDCVRDCSGILLRRSKQKIKRKARAAGNATKKPEINLCDSFPVFGSIYFIIR
jgi:hypothetical protein